jgi:hypothetical protein
MAAPDTSWAARPGLGHDRGGLQVISPGMSVPIAKAVATPVVTRRDTTHLPTPALLRRMARAERAVRTPSERPSPRLREGRSAFAE